ncbi:MAG: hypothetical protein K8S18_04350 [Desulfobacula sp.]|nr:hypothetical protein [Desulfobacula sp.]
MTKLEIENKKELTVKNDKIIELEKSIRILEKNIYEKNKELNSYSTAPIVYQQ